MSGKCAIRLLQRFHNRIIQFSIMEDLLTDIVKHIESISPISAKRLKKHLAKADAVYRERAKSFLSKYKNYLESIGKDFQYSIDCYLHMTADMFRERENFLETGRYSNTSFIDVNARVYANPEVMDYHMHGLVLAQFLWTDQYKRFSFFADNLPAFKNKIRNYLEIGGGHGLYIYEAERIFGSVTVFDLVDISTSSLNLAKGILNPSAINFIHKDIFDFDEKNKYDFITMGEVLEHLEEPEKMLQKIHRLLSGDGVFFITTPANAPMIDHIYLFNNANEIREMIDANGFIIDKEVYAFSEDIPEETAMELKIPLMFVAFLKKKK